MPQIFSRNFLFTLKVATLAMISALFLAVLVWRLVVAHGAPQNEAIEQHFVDVVWIFLYPLQYLVARG